MNLRIDHLTEDRLPALQEAAKQDDHAVLAATHIITKNGEITGYVSLAAVPMVFAWTHTKKMLARDSYQVGIFVENMMRGMKCPSIATLVPKISSFHGILPAAGYTNCGEYSVFVKKL